ncbi:hypothetical protein TNCV_5140071 [Trichonephila clavipes]|nr:hypothetical protein TNCV_5140071 [Trichonephila clavipes]
MVNAVEARWQKILLTEEADSSLETSKDSCDVVVQETNRRRGRRKQCCGYVFELINRMKKMSELAIPTRKMPNKNRSCGMIARPSKASISTGRTGFGYSSI